MIPDEVREAIEILLNATHVYFEEQSCKVIRDWLDSLPAAPEHDQDDTALFVDDESDLYEM